MLSEARETDHGEQIHRPALGTQHSPSRRGRTRSSRTMTRFRIRGLSLYVTLVLAAACTSSASTPPPQTAGTPNERLSAAEFPVYDVDIWRAQSNGLALKAARDRLTREPDSPEITELVLQNQIGGS